MRNRKIEQFSFDKGIVENIKQDLQQNAGAFNSVLWLENYDPNRMHGSLVPRPGLTLQQELQNRDDYGNRYGDSLQHAMVLPASHPETRDNFLFFYNQAFVNDNDLYVNVYGGEAIGSYEATHIVGWLKIDTADDRRANIEHPVYKGWFVFGEFADATKYGQRTIFTTTPGNDWENYKDKLFPCYVYEYFDVSKIKEDDNLYLNGVTFNPNNVPQRWLVRTPSLNLANSVSWLTKVFNWDMGYKGYKKSNEDIAIEWEEGNTGNLISDEDAKDIQVLIWEQPLYTIGELQNEDAKTEKYPLISNNKYVKGFPELRDKMANLVSDSTNSYIASIEIPETTGYSDYVQNTAPYPSNAYFGFPHGERTVTLPNDLGFVSVYDYGYAGDAVLQNVNDNIRRGHAAVTFAYYDYLEANIPRGWLKGEKIPFLLTATLNGTEIKIDDFEYIVQSDYMTDDDRWDEYATGTNIYPTGGSDQTPGIFEVLESNYSDWAGTVTVPVSFRSNASFTRNDYGTMYPTGRNQYITVTLRFKQSALRDFLILGVESFNLYAQRPSAKSDVFNIRGTVDFTLNTTHYLSPDKDLKDEYGNYGLVKSFVLKGDTENINDYDRWYRNNTRTNSWLASDDYYYAVPLVEDSETAFTTLPNLVTFVQRNIKGSSFSDGAEKTNPLSSTDYEYERVDNIFTPDFYLWDYPQDAPSPNIQGSGEYWDGLGARLIQVIKGRTFLAGTYDSDKNKEQAYVRYSAVNSGVISPDVFNKEDWIQVGHEAATALIEFREQLWVFSRNAFYRIGMPVITDVSTWEFYDAVEGQGAISNKAITTTPRGVFFVSENGVWASNGDTPKSFSDDPLRGLAVKSIIQTMATNKTYEYTNVFDPFEGYSVAPYISNYGINKGVNMALELLYDEENDELVLITPYGDETRTYGELRMIYSFAQNNWRAERYKHIKNLNQYDQDNNLIQNIGVPGSAHSNIGRMHFANPSIWSTVKHDRDIGQTDDNYITLVAHDYRSTDEYDADVYNSSTSVGNYYLYQGQFVTHEVGDGQSDQLLKRVIVEGAPARFHVAHDATALSDREEWNIDYYQDEADPRVEYELRNNSMVTDVTGAGWQDLLPANMTARNSDNPFTSLMQRPGGSVIVDPADSITGNESIVLLAPLNTKSRRMRFRFTSRLYAHIRSLTIEFVTFMRRL